MITDEFKKVYWNYYLILERDVLNVEPYVSFHTENCNCFSNEFIKLYQAICSKIDVISKRYCKYIIDKTSITGTGKYNNIKDYAKQILKKHPEIVRQKVRIKEQSDYVLVPWKEWNCDPDDYRNNDNSKNVTPEWWKKYNAVKHGRSDLDSTGKYNYKNANLDNVLNALAALLILEKYFYADIAKDEAPLGKTPDVVISPMSNLFGLFYSEESFLNYVSIGILN